MRRLAAALSALSSLLGLARGTGTFLASDLPDFSDFTPCLDADFLSPECDPVDFLPAVFDPWTVDAFSAAATWTNASRLADAKAATSADRCRGVKSKSPKPGEPRGPMPLALIRNGTCTEIWRKSAAFDGSGAFVALS